MKPAFPEISKIPHEGPSSKNPLAFKHYDPAKVIEDRTMAEHLRFSVAYWHTFRNILSDPFGAGTAIRPWDDGSSSIENACNRAHVAFEFMEKLGAPFYAFHDRGLLVLKPLPPDEVILTGMVDREKVLDPERSVSLKMRLKMLGVHYEMAD